MSNNKTLINIENLLHANDENFASLALSVFRYQHEYNTLYRQYCDALHVNSSAITELTQIPFLPISFFKTHKIVTGLFSEAELTFESSGTTGEVTSKHYVKDAAVYEQSLINGFEQFYGPAEDYAILALLPSYLERKNASLVHMAQTLMKKSQHADNGFYINEWTELHKKLQRLELQGQKTLLLGVTFALLDFATSHPTPLKHTVVMETGGMKGRREEWTRKQVHDLLKQQFQLEDVHSEYGMTELLSQAYAMKSGIFSCTNTMRVLIRDINDPMEVAETGSGCLNIIDLANVHSCSFIATEDLGIIAGNRSFEVLGRIDHSALRGCSLMAL